MVSAPPRTETGRAVERAPVVATGVIVPQGEDLEICPGDRVRPGCPGIALVGGVDPAFVSAQEPATIVRVPGLYDGANLEIDGPIQKLSVARDADYRNPCPEFQTVVPARRYENGNPSPALSDQSEKIVRAHRDRFAGQWWDRTRGTMTLWFTGDGTQLKEQLRSTLGRSRICVFGGARFSEHELEAARERAQAILTERGVMLSGSTLSVLSNRAELYVEAVDRTTLDQVRVAAGDAVVVSSFLELREGEVTSLPKPRTWGEIRLETSSVRGGGQMSALGHFSIHFDPNERCVYLKDRNGERLLPVFPFGYSARENPLEILDHDGQVVARGGKELVFGGGHVPLSPSVQKPCGATSMWVGGPSRDQ